MNKYLDMAAAVLAAQVLFSCSEKELENSLQSHGHIVAHIDNTVESRTAVGDAVDGTSAVGIMWTDGDKLGVFDESGISQKCYAKVGLGTEATASFAVSGSTAFAEPVYAYYPYDVANSSNSVSSLTGTLSAAQNMDDGKLHGDYKYGRATTATTDGAYEFVFKHLFSMARITVDATGTPLAGENMKSLTLSVSRGETPVSIAGDFTFNAEDGTWEQTGDGVSSITLTWDNNAPSLSQAQTCYMSLFPVVKTGDLFTVTVTTENYTAEFTANSLTSFYQERIYNFPVTIDKYENNKVTDNEGNPVQGRFTCATLNVDGLPSLINSGGPGSDGTTKIGNAMNSLGYDFIAISEDFEYHSELAGAMTNYYAGTYRGSVSVSDVFGKSDTDGLGFFWKKEGISATNETIVPFTDAYGGLFDGANEVISKGFRHYEVTVDEGVTVDVYITHMNTYGGDGNTEETNEWVKAQLSQLRQLRDYVVDKAKTNNRPAIIMGDTNLRYTRHKIVDNLITPVAESGLEIVDPWVKFHRGGVYPEWNTKSLMLKSKYAGDTNDILCADDQRGEVVDKVFYINVPGVPLQLEALSCMNEVENFANGTEEVSYTGVTVEDANGNILTGQDVTYTKVNGLADHFPVVVNFKYTIANGN